MLYYTAVRIITPGNTPHPLESFCDFPITTIPGFNFPFYKDVVLSFGNSKIRECIDSFQPDVVHVSTPGIIVYRTIAAVRASSRSSTSSGSRSSSGSSSCSSVPLVMSYHTHLPVYARKYLPVPGVTKLAEFIIRFTHSYADLTLVTSPELKDELDIIGVRRTAVWEKGVNTKVILNII
jgi:sulfoquinovosyltransferase